MKQLASSYVFNKTAKTVTLNNFDFPLNHLLVIINATRQQIIYNLANPALGASNYVQGTNSVVTLEATLDPLTENTDALTIFYDNGVTSNVVLVQGPAGPSGVAPLSDTAPLPLAASATPGTSSNVSRADHVHARPTAADIGAAKAIYLPDTQPLVRRINVTVAGATRPSGINATTEMDLQGVYLGRSLYESDAGSEFGDTKLYWTDLTPNAIGGVWFLDGVGDGTRGLFKPSASSSVLEIGAEGWYRGFNFPDPVTFNLLSPYVGTVTISEIPEAFVPKPAAGDSTKFLKGDGTWANTPSATPNSLSIGTVNTGAAGSSASASITGTAPNQTLSLTIPRGDAGANGTAVLSGTSNPQATQGAIGDFFINTSTNTIFGPKVNAISWPAGVSLVGGNGADGANGRTILSGTSNPTTGTGATGDFYLNTTSNRLFGPKTTNTADATAAWGGGVGLVGPANSLSIGTVNTGAAGSSASASITGTAPSQTLSLTIPQGTPGGPGFLLVLSRSQNALFENSSFVGPSNLNLGLPGSGGGGGRYPVTGNTVEGWFANDTAYPRIFNPLRYLGPGNYRITMYVRVSGAFNDGVHCQLRINQSGVSNSLNNLILPTEFGNLRQFGGGNSENTDRIYDETSNTLSAADQWIQYVPCFGAYGPTGGNNGAYIQDVSLFFFKV